MTEGGIRDLDPDRWMSAVAFPMPEAASPRAAQSGLPTRCQFSAASRPHSGHRANGCCCKADVTQWQHRVAVAPI